MRSIFLLITTIFWQVTALVASVSGQAVQVVKNLGNKPHDPPSRQQLITLPAGIHDPSGQKNSYLYQETKDGITVTALLGNDEVAMQNGEVYLLINLEADDWQMLDSGQTQRKPLNVSLVVDRSGSMAGEKLQSVKKALIDIADYFTGADYVSLVVYDDQVATILEPQFFDRQKFLSAVEKINSGGSTYLEGGLREGLKHVNQLANSQYLNRVILLSDGLANVGIDNARGLAGIVEKNIGLESGSINVSTIGVGADYDEQLMTAVAKAGRGNYYFMESPTQSAQIFEQEFEGLTQMLATQVKVNFNLGRAVSIKQGIGYDYQGGNVFKPYDLSAGKKKTYLFALQVDSQLAQHSANSGVFDLSNLQISFYNERIRKYTQINLPIVAGLSNQLVNPLADPLVYEEYMNAYLAENMLKVYEKLDSRQNAVAKDQLDEVYGNVQQANLRLKGKLDQQVKEVESKQKFVIELKSTDVKASSTGRVFQKSIQSDSYEKVYNK